MAGLSDLIQLIDTNIFDNVGGGVDAGPVRDVFIALATAGISNQNTLDELLELIAVKIPDRVPGSTELIDPNELRDVFVALATAISAGSGSTVIATRKTVCFKITGAADVSFRETINVAAPVTDVQDLIDLAPGAALQNADIQIERGPIVQYLGDIPYPLKDVNVFITFYNYVDASALYDLVQQVLANQNAQDQ